MSEEPLNPENPEQAHKAESKEQDSASRSMDTAPSSAEEAQGGLWSGTIQPLLWTTLSHIAAMFRYYAEHRRDLWRYAIEVMPALDETGDRQREIRIQSDDSIGREAFDGEDWRLVFPDCCVATGQEATGPWVEEERNLPDMAWPFWSLGTGLIGGLLVSLLVRWLWLWPVCFVLGIVVGYMNRRTRRVHLRFRRSLSASTRFPEVRIFPGSLLVRLGNATAKKAFVRHRRAKEEREHGHESGSPGTLSSASRGRQPQESIPLDDDDSVDQKRPSGHSAPPKTREELPPIKLDDEQETGST